MTVQTSCSASMGSDEATFDTQYTCVKTAVNKNPSHREIFLNILTYCEEERSGANVEQYIMENPAYAQALLSPYKLMELLVRCGGLVRTEVDANGAVVDDEMKENLDEDEVEDLVFDELYKTSTAGIEVVAFYTPEQRMTRLLNQYPNGEESLSKVLAYCTSSKTRVQIESFIESEALTQSLCPGTEVHPSVYLDRLEAAGMLIWDGGWSITNAGQRYLETRSV